MSFLSSLLVLLLSSQLQANPYSKREGRLTFDFKSTYLSTTENLDSSGDIVDLPNNNKFEEIKTNIKGEYDYSRYTTFITDLTVNSVTSNDGISERTETALSDIALGFEYILSRKNTFLVMPSFLVKIPLATYSETTDSVLLNNNSIDVEAIVNISKRMQSFYLRAYGGFTYRTEGLSWLAPLGAEVFYISRRFMLGGGIESIFSVTDDDHTSDTNRRTDVTNRVNGGSLAYYAVNPSVTKAYGLFKFYVEPQLYLGLGIKQSLFGENAAYGTEFLANIGFAFGGRNKKIPTLKTQDRDDTPDDFEFQFKEETDKDVDVFNSKKKIRYKEKVEDTLDSVEKNLEIKLKKNQGN